MKNDLRKRIKQMLAGMEPGAAAAASQAIAERVAGLDAFRAAAVVMLYLPIAGEVDTQPLARAAWSAGKGVLAPKACPDTRHMKPVLCHPHEEDSFHPNHGLRCPAGMGAEAVERIDLLIVPALAFDRRRHRLGRGGGFYDRFLARPELRAATVGVAFDEQILDLLPIQPNDQPVDMVVTDREIF